MSPWIALVALMAWPAQDEVDELRKENEKLKLQLQEFEKERDRAVKENDRLKADLEACRQQCFDTAKEIFELRQQLKNAHGGTSKEAPKVPDPEPAKGPDAAEGPEEPLRGRVMFIDKDQGFLLLNLGKKDGVKVGYRFEIVRETKEEGQKELVTKRLAIAEVVGLLGAEETHAKLKVVEGDLISLQLEDEAIAFRKTKPVPPRKEKGEKTFRISGKTNDVYLLNYSGMDGAAPATMLYVYRDKKLIARLHIDKVEKDYSIARVVEGTQTAELREGDTVELQELRILVVGRVKHVHRRTGIYLDFGTDDGAKAGMRMLVTRQGQKVGEIVLDKVERYWSTANVAGETEMDDLKENDFVEETP